MVNLPKRPYLEHVSCHFLFVTAFTDQESEYLQLEPILTDVSKTGVVRFPWKLIRPLLRYKLKSVLDEAYNGVNNIPDDDKDLSRQLLENFDKFKEYGLYECSHITWREIFRKNGCLIKTF